MLLTWPASFGYGLQPIFHPLITDLINQYGGDAAAATVRNSEGTVEDWAGTLQTMAINTHRAAGHRWTGTEWVADNGSGLALFPTKLVETGIVWNDTKPYWPASTAVTVGVQIELDGYWHEVTAIAGSGTTGAAKPTIDTTIGNTFIDNAGANQVTWMNMGYHNNIYGLLTEPSATNVYPSPETVATQTVPVASTGDYTLSVKGSGSIEITADTAAASGYGVASEGTDVTITVTGTGDVTCTLTGSLDTAQMELGSVSTSFTPSSRATESGTIEWAQAGNYNPTEFTMVIDLVFPYDETVLASLTTSFISPDTGFDRFYYNDAAFVMKDGTNAATASNPAWVAGEAIRTLWRAGATAGTMRVGYKRLSVYGSSVVWGTEESFDGTLPSGSLLELAANLKFLYSYRNLPVIYGRDMTITQIEAKYG